MFLFPHSLFFTKIALLLNVSSNDNADNMKDNPPIKCLIFCSLVNFHKN